MMAKKIKRGDTVGIVAPSGFIKEEKRKVVANFVKLIKEKYGIKAVVGKSVEAMDKYGVSAGEPQLRADDINNMFASPEVTCIWCACGGDTANEILNLLDYDLIKKNPKVFIGFSDNTVLLNAIYEKTGLITFHGPDARVENNGWYFDSEYTQNQFESRFLKGATGEIESWSKWRCLRPGKARGKVIGGNIGCFLKLAGTGYLPQFAGSILIFEGYHLTPEHVLYFMPQYQQMGILDQISGLVIGYVYGFQKEEHYYSSGKRVYFEDMIMDLTKDFTFPVLKIEEFGHRIPSTFLPIGAQALLDSNNLSFSLVDNYIE